jgi:hypothetical protein
MDLKSQASAGTKAAVRIPRAPANPLDDFDRTTALKTWDRITGRVPPSTPHPTGDLYICWTPSTLYLGTCMLDMVEPDYYRDGTIPEADRATWNVRLNGSKPITAVVGAGMKPIINPAELKIQTLSGTYHDVRCITAIVIPASHLGIARFTPGDRISLDSTFDSHGKAYQTKWNGTFVLGE